LTTEKDCKRYGRGTCKYYAKLAEQEEGFGKVHPFGKAGRIIRFIAPLNGKIGLDVGCGEGFETRKLSSAGSIMVGCDVDPNLLRIAKKRSRKKPDQSSFIQCDAEHLPLKDAVFDFIVAFDVLEHVQHPKSMLQESSRTLKDGGMLVLAVPNGWGPNELLWGTARFVARVIGLTFSRSAHVQSFNVFFLKQMIRRNGLQIVRIRPHNFLAGAAFVPIQILCAAVNAMMGMEEEEIRVIVGRLCVRLDRSSVGKLLDRMDRVYFNKLFFPLVSGFDFVCLRHTKCVRIKYGIFSTIMLTTTAWSWKRKNKSCFNFRPSTK